MCFTKYMTKHICSRCFIRRKPSLVGAGCPGAMSSFASFFSRLCWWLTVVAESYEVVVHDCTRDPSFRFIARLPKLHLVHSGSCANRSNGGCPHATLMTTSTPKTQWTMANTITTTSTRYACVEQENVSGSHEMCVLN